MRQILLVDDDRESHAALAHACAAFATVAPVRTADQVWQVLAHHSIDLIVCEHHLKDGSGLRLLAAIKAQRPRLPVIMATAHGSEHICASALKLGARDYFIKPWVISEVVASIRAILATSQHRQEIRRNVIDLPVRLLDASPVGRGRIDLAIREAARLIAEHAWETESFTRLARDLGVSKSALSRRFKQTLRVPYRRFLLDSRVTRARELLGTSSLTITEIAQLVGFGDLPRFDKVFKAAVGTPPSRYRQQQTSALQQATSQSL